MEARQELEKLFRQFGVQECTWIDPEDIVVAQWVRMKCTFGCREYGKAGCCPPNVPSVPECERFFREYSVAAIFRFEKRVDKPEDRHRWTAEVNRGLLELERAVFLAGYPKAFLLFMDSCALCEECTGDRARCKHPRKARPAPEAMAVDVFSTVRRYGLPIQVLTDTTQAMNRYAFLMVE